MHWSIAGAALALAALPLAGCDKPEGAGTSIAEAQKAAAKLDRPRPGQYRQTMTVTEFTLPDAPPELAAQLKAAVGQAKQTEFCLTPEQSAQGFQEMFQGIGQDGDCKYERFAVTGGEVDAALHCESEAEGKADFTLAGTVGPAGTDVNVTIDSDNPKAEFARTRIAMQMTTERLGDCPAGE